MNSSKGNALLRTCIHRNDASLSIGGECFCRKSIDMSCISLSTLSGKTPLTNIAGDKLPGCSPCQSSTGESQQEPVTITTAVKDIQIGPARKPVWKGDFEIKDSPSDMAFCEGIIAHPSAKVSRKAYLFSKQLAKVLQFTVYAQSQFLPHLFDANCPNRDDIALYLYPSKYERSKKQYARLLKFMKQKGFMLRSSIGAVELLVFPSTVLDTNSTKLDGHYFMWGVFRHRKRELANAPSSTPTSTSTPNPTPTPTPAAFNTSRK